MPSKPRARSIAALTFACLACGEAAPKAAVPTPAVARGHLSEAELATVTLTPEAVARLGIAVAAVERRPLPRTRRLPGEVVVRPGGLVTLAAPVPGLVLAPGSLPRPGTVVAQGQPLARLIPLAAPDRDLRAQAQSRVAAAEARLTAGTSRAQRAERLIESGAGSERAAEEARVERDVAAAELAAARSRLRMIDRTPLASDVAAVVRAPFAGVVRQVLVADGQAVAGGAALIELVTTEPPWVRVPVFATELGELGGDVAAEVTPLGGEGPPVVAAAVAGPPSADPVAGTVDLHFQLPEGTALRLGQRVAVALCGDPGESLVVPASALVRDPRGGAWVYVEVGEGRYDRRRVEPADTTGELTALFHGPEVGEKVVVAGAVELYGVEFGAGH